MPKIAKKFQLRIKYKPVKPTRISRRIHVTEQLEEVDNVDISPVRLRGRGRPPLQGLTKEQRTERNREQAKLRKRAQRERNSLKGIKEPISTPRVIQHRENRSVAKWVRDTKNDVKQKRNKRERERETLRKRAERQKRKKLDDDIDGSSDELSDTNDDEQNETPKAGTSRWTMNRKRRKQREVLESIESPEERAKTVVGALTPNTKSAAKKILGLNKIHRSGRPRKLNFDQQQLVRDFWQKDSISRVLPGKKRQERKKLIIVNPDGTKTKTNVPKRYLYFTQEEVFMKFKEKHPELPISRSSFYRLKPKEVVQAPPSSRLTCGCVKCINFKFLCQELLETGQHPSEFLNLHTCENCNLRQCPTCKDKMISTIKMPTPTIEDEPTEDDLVLEDEAALEDASVPEDNTNNQDSQVGQIKVKWYQVETVDKKAKLVQKEGTTIEIKIKLMDTIDAHVRHVQLVKIQHQCYDDIRDNLKTNQVLMISDYSENWTIKYPVEAQSMHFCDHQVVILTVVTTMRDPETNELFDEIHLVLSERIDKINTNVQLCHTKIMDDIEERHGVKIDTLFEITDGCGQQYKSRKVLGWLGDTSNKRKYQRYYWESGHGKSKGDGAGGTIKVQLDFAVISQLKVFLSASAVFDYCAENLAYTKPKTVTRSRIFHFIKKDDAMAAADEKDYQRVPGTRAIRQVWQKRRGVIGFREKGCACRLCLDFKFEECDQTYTSSVVVGVEGSTLAEDKDEEEDYEEDPPVFNDVHVGEFIAIEWDKDWYPGEYKIHLFY